MATRKQPPNGNGNRVQWRDVAMMLLGIVLGVAGWFFQVWPAEVRQTDLSSLEKKIDEGFKAVKEQQSETQQATQANTKKLGELSSQVSELKGRVDTYMRRRGD